MKVNIDFEDLETILDGSAAAAVVGIAEAGGTDRAMAATKQALSGPFMQRI